MFLGMLFLHITWILAEKYVKNALIPLNIINLLLNFLKYDKILSIDNYHN